MNNVPVMPDDGLTPALRRRIAFARLGRQVPTPAEIVRPKPTPPKPAAPKVVSNQSNPVVRSPVSMLWAYGVTTVPSRKETYLPRTLASLAAAGFDQPRLFVDGCRNPDEYAGFNLEVTVRWPVIRTYGNWLLSLLELYVRNPTAARYAIFQDDLVTYANLRQYLERTPYPDQGYLNLYTFPSNQLLAPKGANGWYQSNQMGRGAVAIVFSQEAVRTLLNQKNMIEKPLDAHRGHKSVDGAIVTGFQAAGWKEYVHNPSLVQHIGDVSSMRNNRHPQATSFKGEGWNALELLQC